MFLPFFLSFIFAMVLFCKFIPTMQSLQRTGQPIRDDGPQSHLLTKIGTPTMGGIVILLSFLMTISMFIEYNKYTVPLILIIVLNAIIGAIDDIKKLYYHKSKGISAKFKFTSQCVAAILVSVFVGNIFNYQIHLPCNIIITSRLFYILFATFIIVGTSNAVNLTDGLDGLATVPIILSLIVFAIISMEKAIVVSQYNFITMMIFSLIASLLAFLWFNTNPAKIFMGDVGSLSMGAFLGTTALILQKELLLPIVGILFVCETLSVIIQVYSYKTRKVRVFLMAPIHHHFEQKGMSENTIVIRAWIITSIFAIIALKCCHY